MNFRKRGNIEFQAKCQITLCEIIILKNKSREEINNPAVTMKHMGTLNPIFKGYGGKFH